MQRQNSNIKEQMTNKENIAKPATPFILLGVLKGYMKNPIGFIVKSKLSFKKFKKNIELDLPTDFINSTGFIAWLYIRLRKQIGQEKAFEIIRACILTSGLAIQQANFRNVESERTFNNLNLEKKGGGAEPLEIDYAYLDEVDDDDPDEDLDEAE